jgi:uncharacterized protein
MATIPPDPRTTPSRPSTRPTRATMPAGKVLVVILVCLVVWALLAAPGLKRNSEAQPLGTRRTVSLWILTPLAAVSNVFQISRVTGAVSSAFGKDPNAAPGGTLAPLPSVSISPTPSTPPPTKTDAMRVPTSDNKLRIVVVGDSLAQGLGYYLDRVTNPGLTRVSSQGRLSTGLSRPDYFNWPAAMHQIMDQFHPDLVIVMIGENDNQSLQTPGGQLQTQIGTYHWPPAYEDRVREFAKIAINAGAHVVWVGLPTVSDPKRWEVIRRQNEIFQQVASKTPNMAYVDTWDMFATPDGKYSQYLHTGNGNVELVRADDGVHFNTAGYLLIARAAMLAATKDFDLAPRVSQP